MYRGMRRSNRITPRALSLSAALLGAALGFAAPAAVAGGDGYDPDKAARAEILSGWRETDGTHIAATIDAQPTVIFSPMG